MIALTASMLTLTVCAVVALAGVHRRLQVPGPAVMGTACAGSVLGALGAGQILLTGADERLQMGWQAPFGSFALQADALAALFLLPIFVLGTAGIVYGGEYLAVRAARRASTVSWGWYCLFIAAMATVVMAANAMLFLLAWETMSVAAFFLVTHEDDDATVRQAGWTFLIAAHIGTAFLLVMFVILGRGATVLDFEQFAGGGLTAHAAGAVVLLALAGFGTKAGLVPGHVWLPAAHPAAPSHVSAVMSGAMLNTGIYGLLRILTFLPEMPWWTGWLLAGTGLVSGLFGVIFALAQHDLKRLLADSSIENMGLITLAIGLGTIGLQHGSPAMAVLGFGGALLHALNHALFKGLLFLVAGAVLHGTGTRDLDELGGLLRRMPWTGGLFLLAAAAISAFPPLNGFVSEFLIYAAALEGLRASAGVVMAGAATILGLALIGGLVAATFLRASLGFVGTPRSEAAAKAHDPGRAMCGAMAALGMGCVLIGLAPAVAFEAIEPSIAIASGLPAGAVAAEMAAYGAVLQRVSLVAGLLVALVVMLAVVRHRLGAGRAARVAPVWATAYGHPPTARMQYSGVSFVRSLASMLQPVLQTRQEGGVPGAYFPAPGRVTVVTPGLFRERVFEPAFAAVAWLALHTRWVQHGRIQLYLVNIAATLLILLIWKLGIG